MIKLNINQYQWVVYYCESSASLYDRTVRYRKGTVCNQALIYGTCSTKLLIFKCKFNF